MRTNRPHWNLTVPAWQGVYSTPLHPHDQWEPSCPPLEPPEQEPSRPCTLDGIVQHTRPPRVLHDPAKGAFALPWNPSTAVSAAASTKGLSCPLETRSGRSDP